MSLLITFEGIEGAGKSTQIKRVKKFLDQRGIASQVVREPGGTVLGNQIRNMLLDQQDIHIKGRTEMLLYAASRAQLIEEIILPSLKANKIILCDRYVDSSIAYQGFGAGEDLKEIIEVNQIATMGLVPHRTYLLDLPLKLSQDRVSKRGKRKDRMELKEESFHQRVREGYLQLAKEHKQRFKVISAQHSEETVYKEIIQDLLHLMEKYTITSLR